MIGDKIREKRLQVGMSLKELSEKTNLTPGFLSQIERDISEPSITSLRKIAEALEVAVFYFLLDETEKSPVVKKNERQQLKFRDSHVTYELLSPDLNRQMEMFIGRLEPGAMTCEEPLTHQGEEVNHVLQGKMWITIGKDEYVLEEGDTIYYYSSIPHKIVSVGEEDLVFISTITPPRF
ncbi:helix-turn-helix domain-containing protein [Cellulosilyticum sp. I15G10I2]|uniref:helix-turn-helix domain-containing protein n=1 Tax=Cellulosilyticum sp. I15G10I2 TaxID=1892843 RepID=UPI00085BB5BA|nr:XRE family transcriptional regulator [Cellulosilyticum sp. I15G10I2]